MTNSPWKLVKDEPLPEGVDVLLYLSTPYLGSRFVVSTSQKISNGFMRNIGGLFHFDFDTDTIVAWRFLTDLERELPMGIDDVHTT